MIDPNGQRAGEHGRARGDFPERIGLAVVVDPSHQAVEVLSSAQIVTRRLPRDWSLPAGQHWHG